MSTNGSAAQSAEIVSDIFDQARAAIDVSLPALKELISNAASAMIASLDAGGTVLICGNGGSAADAIHLSGELVGRFVDDRRPLSAIALTTDMGSISAVANDYGFDQIFARQVRGLGKSGDVLVAITTSGNSPNVIEAVQMARQMQIKSIVLSGRDGGKVSNLLHGSDLELCVPLQSTARIQEIHGIIIHCLCELIDRRYQGEI